MAAAVLGGCSSAVTKEQSLPDEQGSSRELQRKLRDDRGSSSDESVVAAPRHFPAEQRENVDDQRPLQCIRNPPPKASSICFVQIEECDAAATQFAGGAVASPCDERQFGACFRYTVIAKNRQRTLCAATVDDCDRMIAGMRDNVELKIESRRCFNYRSIAAASPPQTAQAPASAKAQPPEPEPEPEPPPAHWWCAQADPAFAGDDSSCRITKDDCEDSRSYLAGTGHHYFACEPRDGVACLRFHRIVGNSDDARCFVSMRHCIAMTKFIKTNEKDDLKIIADCRPVQ